MVFLSFFFSGGDQFSAFLHLSSKGSQGLVTQNLHLYLILYKKLL